MKNTNSTDFAQLVTGFLTDYLPLQRCYSKNTILSYRDSLKLFLRFITEEKEIKLKSFMVKDFNRETIIEFLEWYRQKGAVSSAANQRLAAIKTFADYAQLECIEYISPLQGVTAIKAKKSSPREVLFLSVEQVSQLINRPDINTPTGLRHRVILTLLYDSGCRVQELCDLTIADIFPGSNPTVRLHGKGDKYRTVVISEETSVLINSYINRQLSSVLKNHPLITNRYHTRIDRDGISYILKKYAIEIRKESPSFPEHVHCHMLRHSKAMHMLAAGINIVYIRDFLGHEDISTTMVYAKADNRLKNEAINKLAPKVTNEEDLPDWNKDRDLMDFLNSLKKAMKKMKAAIKENVNSRSLLVASEEDLIKTMNPKITGWRNYYQTKTDSKWMQALDWYVICTFTRWYNKKHQRRSYMSMVGKVRTIIYEKGLKRMTA